MDPPRNDHVRWVEGVSEDIVHPLCWLVAKNGDVVLYWHARPVGLRGGGVAVERLGFDRSDQQK